MTKHVLGIAVCLAGSIVSAQGDDADPVLRAKAQRALDNHQDLPPIPRGLTEPPPLPPPEMHAHDIRKKRGTTNATARSNARNATQVKKAGTANNSAKKTPPNTTARLSNNSTAKTQSKSTARPSSATSTAKNQNKSATASTAKPSNNSNAKAPSKNAPAKTTKSVNASTAAKRAIP